MPEIFHLEAYVSKQDFPDFGPRARPWAGPMGLGPGPGPFVFKETLHEICTRKMDMPRAKF